MKLNTTRIFVAATLGIVAMVTSAKADIVISEYFYNLNGSESGKSEWIEITNTGASTVDLSGWVYGDSQDNHYSDPFASGTTLAAGSSAVIVFQSASTFQGIWGPGIQVITYTIGGGLEGVSLSNSASPTNETIAIFDGLNNLVDDVNYEVGTNGWPTGNGASIYLLPNAYTTTANDIGTNWATSTVGVDGAYAALTVNPDISNATVSDVASPGVAVSVPEPASLVLMLLAILGVAMIRRV
jgi:hypothetical protein